nr:hypothetical protein BaRGS_004257 [Batillaria attramentaria]
MSTPTQEDHSFGIRNALDTVSFSVSGDAKRRRVADPLISERPESRPVPSSATKFAAGHAIPVTSPVRSAGEPAKDCIDLNDTVFIDVEGDVSDAEKDIDVIDMRDSGLGSIADRSL